MLPHSAAQLVAQQLQLSSQQSLISGSCRLTPLLGVLVQQQQVDLNQAPSSSRSIVTGHTHIPKAQHDRYRTPPQNYVQLLQHIVRSRDVTSLSRLVRQYGEKFDAVHVAAAVAKLPKLYQPPAPGNHLNEKQLRERKKDAAKLLGQLQVTAAAMVPRMYAPQVSSITYALARCKNLLPGGAANITTQQLLDSMLTRVTKDQGRLLWQGATGTSIKQLLHGLSRMGYSPVSSGSSAASAASTATNQLCRIIAKDPSRLQVRELATAAWALAKFSRKVSGQRHVANVAPNSSVAAALDAISAEVVARKLWLRPDSMTGLLTAAVWLGRKDEALLAAICEEATHQVRDLRPPHLSAFAWGLASLEYPPPPELLAGIISESRRQLQHFEAGSLGLLLLGLRQLGALDKQLLAEVAAGIAAEEEVSLAPRDAVRILAAYVAEPTAGTVKDVEGMAQRIASAIRRPARNAGSAIITDLLVCYSKLACFHPMVPQLLDEARLTADSFTLNQWAKLLQSAARFGFDRVVADPDLELTLSRFYRGAEAHLQEYLLKAVLLRSAGAGRQQQEDGEEQGLTGKFKAGLRFFNVKGQQQQQPGTQQQVQQQQHPHQFKAIAEIAVRLGQRGSLSDDMVTDLADAAALMLPQLKLRQITQLLNAVTSRDTMLADARVCEFVLKAAEHVRELDLSSTPTATTTVLVSLLQPLSKAVSRGTASVAGEVVIRAVYAELLPVLEECDQEQLQSLWQATRRSGVQDEALHARVKEVAHRHGWQLQSGSLSIM